MFERLLKDERLCRLIMRRVRHQSVCRCHTFGLKLSVGRMCSCCARGVPQGWYSLKHSLQKLALQSAQPLVASRVWGGLQNWHVTATLPRLTVCLYLGAVRKESERETALFKLFIEMNQKTAVGKSINGQNGHQQCWNRKRAEIYRAMGSNRHRTTPCVTKLQVPHVPACYVKHHAGRRKTRANLTPSLSLHEKVGPEAPTDFKSALYYSVFIIYLLGFILMLFLNRVANAATSVVMVILALLHWHC